ncbi:MAG: sel1 repeat family protein [Deltaproteobacteria bacterium]|nr:sel1 repeat family protein [Deltaproteobacteria bacterium]
MEQKFFVLLITLTAAFLFAVCPLALAQTESTATGDVATPPTDPGARPAQVESTASGQLSPPPSTEGGDTGVRTVTVEQYLELLNQEVQNGNNEAMITLGIIYERGQLGIDQNYGTAMEWFQKAADAGVPEGYFNLGYFYQVGAGTAPDFTKALLNYQKAAELNLGVASYRLGQFYLFGKIGLTPNPEVAVKYLTEAGKRGVQDADYLLASLYLNGANGVTQDIPAGIKLLNELAEKRNPVALNELGAIYYLGQWNQAQDLPKSKDFFLRAADLGFGVAMKNLAAYYRNVGDNQKPNLTLALQWAILSINFGQNNQEMNDFIAQLRSEMRAEEVTAAETAAQEWVNQKIAEAQQLQQQQQAEANRQAQAQSQNQDAASSNNETAPSQ